MSEDNNEIPDELHERRIARLEERLAGLEKTLAELNGKLKSLEHGAKSLEWAGAKNTLGSMAKRLGEYGNDVT